MTPAGPAALCRHLGIDHPILSAGMGNVAGAELVVAVCEAGALGVLGGAEREPDQLREEIRRVKAATGRPFGVDLLLAAIGTDDPATGPDATLPAFAYSSKVLRQLEIVFEEGVPVLVSGLGDPAPYVAEAHDRGMVVMALVGDVVTARKVADGGADYVIAQGHEAGGHTGRIATMALVPAIDDAVRVPVLAAGGIADGRGVAAALALGAVGVWIGSRFLASRESHVHENFKQRVVEIDHTQTVVTRAYTGKTARTIANDYTREWERRPGDVQRFPDQFLAAREHFQGAMAGGDVANGFMPAGQICGQITDLPSAGELVRRLAAETGDELRRLSDLAGDGPFAPGAARELR